MRRRKVSPPSLSIVKHSKHKTPCSSLATTPECTRSLITIRLRTRGACITEQYVVLIKAFPKSSTTSLNFKHLFQGRTRYPSFCHSALSHCSLIYTIERRLEDLLILQSHFRNNHITPLELAFSLYDKNTIALYRTNWGVTGNGPLRRSTWS